MQYSTGPRQTLVSGWAHQRCHGCGCSFAVRFKRECVVSGHGPALAYAEVIEQLTNVARDPEVECSCPECGRPPLRRVAKRRGNQDHIRALAVACTAVAGVAPMAFFVERSLGFGPALIAVAVFAAAALAWQVGVALWFPFRPSQDAVTSLTRGRRDGRLEVSERGHEGYEPTTKLPGRLACYLPAVAALVLTALPSVYLIASPAPRNAGCIPEVVGPGRTVRLFADEEVPCIDGYWVAETLVVVTAADRAELVDLEWDARTKSGTLPNRIETKSHPGSHQSVRLWVDLDIPGDPALTDRSFRVEATIAVLHPKWFGNAAFEETETVVHKTQTLTLASRSRAADQYYLSWAGIIGAAVVLLVAELCCHLGNRRMRDAPLPELKPDPEPDPATRAPSRRGQPADE